MGFAESLGAAGFCSAGKLRPEQFRGKLIKTGEVILSSDPNNGVQARVRYYRGWHPELANSMHHKGPDGNDETVVYSQSIRPIGVFEVKEAQPETDKDVKVLQPQRELVLADKR